MVPSFESPDPTPTPDAAPRPVGARIAFILVVAGLVAVIGFVTWQGTLRSRPVADTGAGAGPAGTTGSGPGVVTLAVDGMSCVGCASTVETTLEEVPGVAEVHVDYEHRLARIRLVDPDVSPDALVAAVEHAGYKARVEK